MLRWVGFAYHGTPDLNLLRLSGELSQDDARKALAACEFLTRLRMDLHFHAGLAQEVLNRDEQLRIAENWGYRDSPGQRGVERFMQEYFRHATALASISRRFVQTRRKEGVWRILKNYLVEHKFEGIYRIRSDVLEVPRRHRGQVVQNLTSILRMYRLCSAYGIVPSPSVEEVVSQRVAELSGTEFHVKEHHQHEPTDPLGTHQSGPLYPLTKEQASLFLDILRTTKPLGPLLRSLFQTRTLDLLIPDIAHIRCLMQFNQYHSFTVDEHTLRTIEAVTSFVEAKNSLGDAYRAVRNKHLLHLALLLHDAGKGFGESHSRVGARIAERIGRRLFLSEADRQQVVFLVLQHLDMAHQAFARDITDPEHLVEFSRMVGSPDNLRMLYVLTAADVMSVARSVWNDWKAELLHDLFDRCTELLSGKPCESLEHERLTLAKQRVVELMDGSNSPYSIPIVTAFRKANPDLPAHEIPQKVRRWIEERMQEFPAHHLAGILPEQIASDLAVIAQLGDREIDVDGRYEPVTRSMEYRIVTRQSIAARGCFCNMAGVLTALRMEILTADIFTTKSGIVVDRFQVIDRDYQGPVPPIRVMDVSERIKGVLRGEFSVEALFQRHQRFVTGRPPGSGSNLRTRVELDPNSSESRLIIDVFAHDRPGLLYTLTKALYDLDLSVDLAKISTHFDQVLDIFYVTELDGTKPAIESRVSAIRQTLLDRLHQFEVESHATFVT